MKKIKLYIIASIDGFISRLDGDLDWIREFPNPESSNYGYQSYYDSIDTIIMDGQTYLDIMNMDIQWPFKEKQVFVFGKYPIQSNKSIHIITEDEIEFISNLKAEKGEDISLTGTSELTTLLLNQHMIDEMVIVTIPVILGNGIPMFSNNMKESKWKLKDIVQYKNGVTLQYFII